jgi:hypothetical protein
VAFPSCQIQYTAKTAVSTSGTNVLCLNMWDMYLAGTAALVVYMEPSAGHQEVPFQGELPYCTGAYETAALVAAGIHSELPLVSDSYE